MPSTSLPACKQRQHWQVKLASAGSLLKEQVQLHMKLHACKRVQACPQSTQPQLASRSSQARMWRDTSLGAASASRAARLLGVQSSAVPRSATLGCWNSLWSGSRAQC